MNTDPEENKMPEAPPATPAELARRRFLTRLSLGIGGGLLVGLGAPTLGFILAPLAHRKPELWRPIGEVDAFKVGETVAVRYDDPSALPWAGVTARTAAWLRRESSSEFIAFSVHCTHLGCPVRWMPKADLFLCPCHGGVYYRNGQVAAGPPSRALPRYPVRVVNKQVEIQTAPLPILTRKA